MKASLVRLDGSLLALDIGPHPRLFGSGRNLNDSFGGL